MKNNNETSKSMSNLRNSSLLSKGRQSLSNLFSNINSNQENSINYKLLQYKEIKQISKKLGLSPIIIISILIIVLIFIMFGFYEDHLTILIGTAYPLYFSLKTLKKPKLEKIKRWLTYWIFFIFFIWFESICYFLLKYIPLYFLLRSIFLVLCYLPEFELSTIFYDKFIKKLHYIYREKVLEIAKKLSSKLYDIKTEEEEKLMSKSMSLGANAFRSYGRHSNFSRGVIETNSSSPFEKSEIKEEDEIDDLTDINTGDPDAKIVDDSNVFTYLDSDDDLKFDKKSENNIKSKKNSDAANDQKSKEVESKVSKSKQSSNTVESRNKQTNKLNKTNTTQETTKTLGVKSKVVTLNKSVTIKK